MKTKLYIFVLALATFFFGCTKNFEDFNTNPNNPSPNSVDPAMLLTYIQKHGGIGNADLHQRFHNIMVDQFCQYSIDLPAVWNTDNYWFGRELPWMNQYWGEFYTWINAANQIISQNKDKADKNNLVQITRIWKIHMYLQATDFFGDVPYFKAADGSGIVPDYDPLNKIYDDFFAELKDAVAKLDVSAPAGSLAAQDIIFGGDASKWKKYGNSLRLRIAMRIVKVDAAKARTNAEEAVTGGVFGDSDSDVSVPPLPSRWGDMYPLPMYIGWGETAMTQGFLDILTGLGGTADAAYVGGIGDPRGTVYYTPVSGLLKGIRVGLGPDQASLGANQPSANSRANTNVITANRRMVVMPVSEVFFLRAEGATYGWDMGATAQSLYENGVKYSMKQWGVKDAVVADYLASTSVNKTGTSVAFTHNTSAAHNSQLEKIITQKYIAGWPDNGFEAWADHRRLLMPYLLPVPYVDPSSGVTQWTSGEPTHANYIQRILYPPSESVNNKDKYEAVKAKDKVTVPVWWTGRQ